MPARFGSPRGQTTQPAMAELAEPAPAPTGGPEADIDERFEYDAPRFYDFDEGSPTGAPAADGWFDTDGPKGAAPEWRHLFGCGTSMRSRAPTTSPTVGPSLSRCCRPDHTAACRPARCCRSQTAAGVWSGSPCVFAPCTASPTFSSIADQLACYVCRETLLAPLRARTHSTQRWTARVAKVRWMAKKLFRSGGQTMPITSLVSLGSIFPPYHIWGW